MQPDTVPGIGPFSSQYYSTVMAALAAEAAGSLGAHSLEFYALFEQQAAAVSSAREVGITP